MRSIAIIGSTGSIGTQTLDVVRANADIRVAALAAGDNIELLEKQVREFRPELVSVKSEDKAKALAAAYKCFLIRKRNILSCLDCLNRRTDSDHADNRCY